MISKQPNKGVLSKPAMRLHIPEGLRTPLQVLTASACILTIQKEEVSNKAKQRNCPAELQGYTTRTESATGSVYH